MDFIFLVGWCLELGVPWKKASPTLKRIFWQMTTEIVHILKCIVQREKQTNKQTYPVWPNGHMCSFSSLTSPTFAFSIEYGQNQCFKSRLLCAVRVLTLQIYSIVQPFRMLNVER